MIYLDHNATTPIDPAVREAMEPYLSQEWGNASSSYSFGSRLRAVVETARLKVARLLNASPDEVVFTSGGTEANNAAIHAALLADPARRHIVTTAVEHSSVLSYCQWLKSRGNPVTIVGVNADGRIDYEALEAAITKNTAIVSVMWANNETGVLFPVDRIANQCHQLGVPFHSDAVQVAGKIPIDVKAAPFTYLGLAAHKFNGPKGIGVLYVRRGAPFTPLVHGGHQERGRRGGTEDVAAIVGLGLAAEKATASAGDYARIVAPRRDRLESALLERCGPARIHGRSEPRIANTTNMSFPGIGADGLLMMLDKYDLYASAGSACLADSGEPSHVIAAMHGSAKIPRDFVRLSISASTSDAEINEAVERIAGCVVSLRALSA
jgi:cysteine desulfurase